MNKQKTKGKRIRGKRHMKSNRLPVKKGNIINYVAFMLARRAN